MRLSDRRKTAQNLVHVVQSVLQWGKDPIVLVKREEGSKYKATQRTNQ